MQASANLQRVLGTACGVVFLVGVLAAATKDDGSDDDPDSAEVAAGQTTTSTLPGSPGASVTVATLPGDPGTTAATTADGQPVATTASPAGDDGGGGDDPGGNPGGETPTGVTPSPPALGQYTYSISGSDGTSTSYNLNIDDDPDAPADRLVGAEGASLGLIERYRWGADGVYVIGGSFTALGDASCEWAPPVLQVKAPVVAGTQWGGIADCVATTQVGEIAVHAETVTTVVELLQVEVAGRTRQAARLSRDENQVVTVASNTARSTAHYDDVIDVLTGMVISSSATATTEGSAPGSSQRQLIAVPDGW